MSGFEQELESTDQRNANRKTKDDNRGNAVVDRSRAAGQQTCGGKAPTGPATNNRQVPRKRRTLTSEDVIRY
jgi:hypothetical protein